MTTTNTDWYRQNDRKQRKNLRATISDLLSRFYIVYFQFGKEEGTRHYRFTMLLREKGE